MQTSDIERRYRATISPPPLRFTFLVYPSLRATTTIYIVTTGGAVLYSPFTSPGRNFRTGEISRANVRARETRRNGTLSRAYPVMTTLGIAPQKRTGYPRKIYTYATGQFQRPVRYRSPTCSSCRPVDARSSAAIYIRGWRRRWKAAAGFNAHASCIFKAPAWYSCTRKLNPNAGLRMATLPAFRTPFSSRCPRVSRSPLYPPPPSRRSPLLKIKIQAN